MHQLSLLEIVASNENEVLQLETLTLPNPLQKLIFAGRFSEGTLKSQYFSNHGDALHTISLYCSQLVENPFPRLSEFFSLTKIFLKRAYTGQELNFHPGWFPNVKVILLMDLPNTKKIHIHEGTLVLLEELVIRNLAELQDIPTGVEYLKCLKEALFLDMHPNFERNFPTTKLKHVQRAGYTIRSEVA